MKNKLRRAIYVLEHLEQASQVTCALNQIDARAKLLVTIVFLVCMLSTPLHSLSQLLLYFLYPILLASFGGINYMKLFKQSLFVLPFVILIGIFNLFYHTSVAMYVNGIAISSGTIEFISIILRGLLSVQAVILLVEVTGFYNICISMQRLGVPSLFTGLLLFVYRYMTLMLKEALNLSMACQARSFGRSSFPLRIWATLILQLIIKTFDRAEWIGKAMSARCFSGTLMNNFFQETHHWKGSDTIFLSSLLIILIVMRIFPFMEIFSQSI